jgi:hypothetical protein
MVEQALVRTYDAGLQKVLTLPSIFVRPWKFLTLFCLGKENIYLDDFDVKLRKKLSCTFIYVFFKYLFLQKRKTNLF